MDRPRVGAIGMWVVAALWNAVAVPIAVVAIGKSNVPWWVYAVAAIFPAVGLGLVWTAINATRFAMRFGPSTLTLEPCPARPGEPVNATVRLATTLDAAGRDLLAKLACIHSRRRGTGKNRRTWETAVWEDERPAEVDEVGRTTTIRVSFTLPADAAETDHARADDRTIWRLTLRGTGGRLAYRARFEVPVRARTADDHEAPVTPFEPPPARPVPAGIPYEELARQRIKARPLAGRGLTVEFPAGRWVVSGLMITAFAIACDAVAYFALVPGGWFGPVDAIAIVFRAMFAIVFGAIGLFLSVVAAGWWLVRTHLRADRDGLTITRRALGFRRTRTYEPTAIRGIEPRRSMTQGDRAFYTIRVDLGGRCRDVGSAIEGRLIAEQLVTGLRGAIE